VAPWERQAAAAEPAKAFAAFCAYRDQPPASRSLRRLASGLHKSLSTLGPGPRRGGGGDGRPCGRPRGSRVPLRLRHGSWVPAGQVGGGRLLSVLARVHPGHYDGSPELAQLEFLITGVPEVDHIPK
jgi:hypothetical protein